MSKAFLLSVGFVFLAPWGSGLYAQPLEPPPTPSPELLPPSSEPAPLPPSAAAPGVSPPAGSSGVAPPPLPAPTAPTGATPPPPRPTPSPTPTPPPLAPAPPTSPPPDALPPPPPPALPPKPWADPLDLESPAALDERAVLAAAPAAPRARDRALFASTLLGPVGLLRTSAALTGEKGSWRLSLRGEYASGSSLIVEGDENRRLGGALALSLTPLSRWEIFATVLASSNHNQRCVSGAVCEEEPDRVDPPYIRSFGDVVLGSKIAERFTPRFALGAELGARFFSSDDGLGFDFDATSPFFAALATVDLRDVPAFPVMFHGNLGYVADRSRNLADFQRLSTGMINSRAVAGFAYGYALPRVRTAIGFGAPFGGGENEPFIHPFVEYQIERITGDPDPGFLDYTEPRCGPAGGQKPCSDRRFQERLVFGLRAGSTGGLALDLALEIGTGSVGHAFGPPLPTWNFIFGFGYAFDPAQNRPIVRTVTVERVIEKPVAPPLGFVGGRVVNATTGEPIAGAIIDVPGRTRVRVATDSDGAFVSKGFAAGPVDLEISAPGYGAQAVRATVQVGATTPVEVSLLPMPPPPDLTPAAPTPPATPAPPAPTSEAPLPPPSGAVSLQAGRLVLRNPIRFVGSPTTPTAELTADSRQILDEVAAFLRQQPAVDKIRIEAHWDSGIDRALALQITQDQANAVAQYLASRGFARDGIEAEGFGATRPRGPNLGPQSRARNRRIEISLPGLLARP